MRYDNFDVFSIEFMMSRILLFFFFSSIGFCQALRDISADYSLALKMKIIINEDSRLKLDEPRSADLERMNDAMEVYLSLIEKNANHVFIKRAKNIVIDASNKYFNRYYNPNLKPNIKKNIRYHYLSLGSPDSD